MLESAVVRTPPFLESITWITNSEYDRALIRLTSLREQYASDPHSEVEIDRWIAHVLSRSGKIEEAYALLQKIRPTLEEYQFDLSLHHFEVVKLLQLLGKSDELQSYCKNIDGHFVTNDTLGHLDWILQYAASAEASQPSVFMYTVLALSTIRLGLDVPPRSIAGADFCRIVQRCIELRDRWGSSDGL